MTVQDVDTSTVPPRRLVPTHRKLGLACGGLELAVAGLCAGLLAQFIGADTVVWTWAAVWVFLRVMLCSTRSPRSLRAIVVPPVATGAAVIVLAFVVEHFFESWLVTGEVLLVVGVLGLTSLLVRAMVGGLHRPHTVRLVDDHFGAVPADTARVHHVAVNSCIKSDPEALAQAVRLAVDSCEAETVDLCPGLDRATVDRLVWALRHRQVGLRLPLDVTAVRAGYIEPELVAGQASLMCHSSTPSLRLRVAKRLFDVLGSAALILLLSPVLIAVALVVRLDSPGPVLFRQRRIGIEGEAFSILKFRTMVVDADAQLAALLEKQNSGGTPLFKVADDPRITRHGGFLRRYSLDELPQLFNVLGGTMSLVGPRPQRAEEVALYTGTAVQRLGVKPGMTGLWQVSGRSNLPWQRAQELDVYYAHNWNLGLDLQILARTARAVVASEGAV